MVQLKRNETLASLLKEAKAETVKEVETRLAKRTYRGTAR